MTEQVAIIKIKGNHKFTPLIRILSILLICLYVVFFYDVLFEWYAYTLRYFVMAFFVYLALITSAVTGKIDVRESSKGQVKK